LPTVLTAGGNALWRRQALRRNVWLVGARYRIDQLIARGGMAEVFRGVAVGAEGFEKPVAIKRLLPQLLADPQLAAMFADEAQLARHLHHQNVVSVVDVIRDEQGLLIVMELVDGWDLRTLLGLARAREVRFPATLAAHVAAQVAAGLCHAYGRRVEGRAVLAAHRDVSDSNVLVSTEGEVKLADFGIARLEREAGGTAPGTFKGRFAYAAPELLDGAAATPESDQYALGVLLYQLLCGRHPFGDPEQLAALVDAQRRGLPAIDEAPPTLWAVLQRMLAPAPTERYAPPEVLPRALGAYLARCGEPAGSAELAAFVRSLEPDPPPSLRTDPTAEALDPTLVRPHSDAPSSRGSSNWAAAVPSSAEADLARFAHLGQPQAEVAASMSEPEELELARPARSPAAEEELASPVAAPSRRLARWLRPLLTLLVLAATLGAGTYLLSRAAGGGGAVRMLRIESEPSGARIQVGEEELGLTPLALENYYPPGASVPVRLELRGYRPWTGTFIGGSDAKLSARLEPR
jgi:eukaryotic-like serine/threonine-protein kinase